MFFPNTQGDIWNAEQVLLSELYQYIKTLGHLSNNLIPSHDYQMRNHWKCYKNK